jgi:hypothetical protein
MVIMSAAEPPGSGFLARLKRLAWHLFVAPALAIAIGYVSTLGVSAFEGGRGYAALGVTLFVLVAYVPVLLMALKSSRRMARPWRLGLLALESRRMALWATPEHVPERERLVQQLRQPRGLAALLEHQAR